MCAWKKAYLIDIDKARLTNGLTYLLTHDFLRYINILTYLLTYLLTSARKTKQSLYATEIVVSICHIFMNVFCFNFNNASVSVSHTPIRFILRQLIYMHVHGHHWTGVFTIHTRDYGHVGCILQLQACNKPYA